MRRNFFHLCCAGMALCLCFMACNKETEQEQEKPAVTLNQQEENWEKIEHAENIELRASIASGKALANLTGVGTADPYYCNVEANLSNGKGNVEPHLVCKDPVYDITYYVNYGRDYFIYASRSGVSEVAVEIPAKDLFCREGELYFIVENYDTYILDGMEQGNILKYNPVDGTVEPVINKYVLNMRVFPDGINYEERILEILDENNNLVRLPADMVTSQLYYYSFETGESNPLLGGIDRWKDKGIEQLSRFLTESEKQSFGYEGTEDEWMLPDGWAVVDSEGKHLAELTDAGSITWYYRIQGNSMYYVKATIEEQKAALMEFNCETGGNRQVVKFEPHGDWFNASDFIILEGVVYFGNEYRYSLEDGRLTMLACKGEDFFSTVNTLYTDGEELFGVYDGRLWKIELEKAAEEDVSMVEVEEVPVVYGEYIYSLVEP